MNTHSVASVIAVFQQRLERAVSPPTMLEKVASHFTPRSAPVLEGALNAKEEPLSHEIVSVANPSMEYTPIRLLHSFASTGHEGNALKIGFSSDNADYVGPSLARAHRLEATAILARLLGSRFFKNATNFHERIGLLTILCKDIQKPDVSVKTARDSQSITGISVQIEKSVSQPEDSTFGQRFEQEQVSVSSALSLSRKFSSPRSPGEHEGKRERPNLTLRYRAGLAQTPNSEVPLWGAVNGDNVCSIAPAPGNISLSVLRSFNFGYTPEPESPSPTESRQGRVRIRRFKSGNDVRLACYTTRDENTAATHADQDRVVSSVEVRE